MIAHVPQIKGLTVSDILAEARRFVKIDEYMPNLGKGKQPDRNFVCNIGKLFPSYNYDLVNTLIPNKLRDLIEDWMSKREVKFIKKRNLEMKVLPEFKELFCNAPGLSSKLQSNYAFRITWKVLSSHQKCW